MVTIHITSPAEQMVFVTLMIFGRPRTIEPCHGTRLLSGGFGIDDYIIQEWDALAWPLILLAYPLLPYLTTLVSGGSHVDKPFPSSKNRRYASLSP